MAVRLTRIGPTSLDCLTAGDRTKSAIPEESLCLPNAPH